MGKNVKDVIRGLLDERSEIASRDVAAATGLTRQAAHYHLRALVEAGELERLGAGRGTRYRRRAGDGEAFVTSHPLEGLAESEVWREVVDGAPALRGLEASARDVFAYAVTEMVNNAIDHSRGERVVVRAARQGGRVVIDVEDDGEGAFAHIRREIELEFSRTRIVVKLFEYGVRFVSRSEAKRLLRDLETFREVVLDFAGVESVGQGFADEVFRVWARGHPEIALAPVNMNDAVRFMVDRARASAA